VLSEIFENGGDDTVDFVKMLIEGDQFCAMFHRLRSDPDVIGGNRGSLVFEPGRDP